MVLSQAALIVTVTNPVTPATFVATTLTYSEKIASGLIVRVGYRSPLTVTPATLILAVFVQAVPSAAYKA